MAPASTVSPVDHFASLDHFYLLRPPLRPYVDLQSRRYPNPKTLEPARSVLCKAIALHNSKFPSDLSDHPGYRHLLATLSFYWAKDEVAGERPSWYLPDSDLVVRN